MAKGVIESGGADGYYTVSVQLDAAAITARKEDLQARNAAQQTALVSAELALAAQDAAYSSLISAQNDLIDAFAADPTSDNLTAVNDKSAELAKAAVDGGLQRSAVAALKLEISSLNKEIARLSSPPSSAIASVWCADYIEDLTGEVGLIEVPGGEPESHLQIRPGYVDAAAYTPSRDGSLRQPFADVPAATAYNIAMLPGWQKWYPRYRTGIITSVDPETDSCSVRLDAVKSGQQQIDINYTRDLDNVPIEYMDCDSIAFDVADNVVVEFTDQAITGIDGNWAEGKARVIGFKSEPKPCAINGVVVYVTGDAAPYGWDESMIPIGAGDCAETSPLRLYSPTQIYHGVPCAKTAGTTTDYQDYWVGESIPTGRPTYISWGQSLCESGSTATLWVDQRETITASGVILGAAKRLVGEIEYYVWVVGAFVYHEPVGGGERTSIQIVGYDNSKMAVFSASGNRIALLRNLIVGARIYEVVLPQSVVGSVAWSMVSEPEYAELSYSDDVWNGTIEDVDFFGIYRAPIRPGYDGESLRIAGVEIQDEGTYSFERGGGGGGGGAPDCPCDKGWYEGGEPTFGHWFTLFSTPTGGGGCTADASGIGFAEVGSYSVHRRRTTTVTATMDGAPIAANVAYEDTYDDGGSGMINGNPHYYWSTEWDANDCGWAVVNLCNPPFPHHAPYCRTWGGSGPPPPGDDYVQWGTEKIAPTFISYYGTVPEAGSTTMMLVGGGTFKRYESSGKPPWYEALADREITAKFTGQAGQTVGCGQLKEDVARSELDWDQPGVPESIGELEANLALLAGQVLGGFGAARQAIAKKLSDGEMAWSVRASYTDGEPGSHNYIGGNDVSWIPAAASFCGPTRNGIVETNCVGASGG